MKPTNILAKQSDMTHSIFVGFKFAHFSKQKNSCFKPYVFLIYLDIATSTVNLLLVLHCELNDQGLPFIRKGVELRGNGIKFGILGSLES